MSSAYQKTGSISKLIVTNTRIGLNDRELKNYFKGVG
jgi:hypothetical protein